LLAGTPWTPKPLGPSQLFQIGATGIFRAKPGLKILQVKRKILHPGVHYIVTVAKLPQGFSDFSQNIG
jgi:hypothetical protein